MRKVFALLVLGCILMLASSAFATTQTFSTTDFKNLYHGTNYTWYTDNGVWGIPTGEYIVSAQLKINNLNNDSEFSQNWWTGTWTQDNDYMNIYLLNNPFSNSNWPTKTLLTVFRDENGYFTYGYYWGHQYITGAVNPGEDLVFNLTSDQLGELTSYVSDKIFGLGFDPNCAYTDTKITFTIVTDKIPVQTPEPTTMILFGLGLLGLVRVRRKMKK